MNLITLGELVKGLDKMTNSQFLTRYPQIYWTGAMKMRDKIAHHYFEIDEEVVLKTIRDELPPMLPVLEKMQLDAETELF